MFRNVFAITFGTKQAAKVLLDRFHMLNANFNLLLSNNVQGLLYTQVASQQIGMQPDLEEIRAWIPFFLLQFDNLIETYIKYKKAYNDPKDDSAYSPKDMLTLISGYADNLIRLLNIVENGKTDELRTLISKFIQDIPGAERSSLLKDLFSDEPVNIDEGWFLLGNDGNECNEGGDDDLVLITARTAILSDTGAAGDDLAEEDVSRDERNTQRPALRS